MESKEGKTQRDILGMAIYVIVLFPLLGMMFILTNDNYKIVAFADDLTAVGICESLRK